MYHGFFTDFPTALRQAAFQVVTLVSTCGFATENYIPWGPFFWMIALILMFICGCAGSTCGGLKMGRFVILSKNLFNEFKNKPIRMPLPGKVGSHTYPARSYTAYWLSLLPICH